jgi:hypothetical protein
MTLEDILYQLKDLYDKCRGNSGVRWMKEVEKLIRKLEEELKI